MEISFCRGARETETSEVTFQGLYLVKDQRVERSCPYLQSGLIHRTYCTAYTDYTVFSVWNFFGHGTLIDCNIATVTLVPH